MGSNCNGEAGRTRYSYEVIRSTSYLSRQYLGPTLSDQMIHKALFAQKNQYHDG